ncbi:unnamed protein product [Moneuplotes crassus]|uniref:Protein kinase domain-containing protein n=1 Tax=Euplotes crassus TaxID=5936 RepID=A0AAD1XUW9_EUPCR|nr:unnamed protein product [Moneuplotes crassus]
MFCITTFTNPDSNKLNFTRRYTKRMRNKRSSPSPYSTAATKTPLQGYHKNFRSHDLSRLYETDSKRWRHSKSKRRNHWDYSPRKRRRSSSSSDSYYNNRRYYRQVFRFSSYRHFNSTKEERKSYGRSSHSKKRRKRSHERESSRDTYKRSRRRSRAKNSRRVTPAKTEPRYDSRKTYSQGFSGKLDKKAQEPYWRRINYKDTKNKKKTNDYNNPRKTFKKFNNFRDRSDRFDYHKNEKRHKRRERRKRKHKRRDPSSRQRYPNDYKKKQSKLVSCKKSLLTQMKKKEVSEKGQVQKEVKENDKPAIKQNNNLVKKPPVIKEKEDLIKDIPIAEESTHSKERESKPDPPKAPDICDKKSILEGLEKCTQQFNESENSISVPSSIPSPSLSQEEIENSIKKPDCDNKEPQDNKPISTEIGSKFEEREPKLDKRSSCFEESRYLSEEILESINKDPAICSYNPITQNSQELCLTINKADLMFSEEENMLSISKECSELSYEESSQSMINTLNSQDSSLGEAPHLHAKPGMIIHNYRIIKDLGEGTFGKVFLAQSLFGPELFALKIIRPCKKYLESANFEYEICKEVQTLALQYNHYLESPQNYCVNVVENFDFTLEDSDKYKCLVFEALGRSLYDVIKENNYRGFPVDQIMKIAHKVLKALDFLHSIHITHTDIKPENILFTCNKTVAVHSKDEMPSQLENKKVIFQGMVESEDLYDESLYAEYQMMKNPDVKLIDFGGATKSDEKGGRIINTRQYRSPEVILGCCNWDHKSDIWSVACVLVELYTGELFFPAHHDIEHLCMIEKVLGPIEEWMILNAGCVATENESKKWDPYLSKKPIKNYGNSNWIGRVRWAPDEIIKDRESYTGCIPLLSDIILPEHNKFHCLLKEMFIKNPKKRPNACELISKFFSEDYNE